MKEKQKDIILYGIAIILFFIVSLIIVSAFKERGYVNLFWICYFAMFLIVIGIITKNSNLILSQVIILAIPDLFWIFDFFAILITGNSPLGIAKYFFQNRPLLQEIASLQHFFTVPLSLLAMALIRVKKKNYKVLFISLIEILFFFALAFIIPNLNVNCLPDASGCISIVLPSSIPYPLIWLVVQFSFVIISYFAINRLLFIRKN